MANYLEVSMRTTIEQLKRQGWSIRQIARELGINRRTVAKYSRGISLPLTNSKCTIPPAGNLAGTDSKCATSPARVPAGTQHTASQSSCVPNHRFIVTGHLKMHHFGGGPKWCIFRCPVTL